ncbi:MAG: type 4a pilus biogenesis protein PilO [Deltaproteobacteria bacterium]|nr:type 4a pilus biogenesis protein PilO [Deltaproteobacteria bacterium]
MKELNTREKIIVSVVAVVAVAFLVNRFVLEPQSKKMKQLRKELASLNEQEVSIGPKLVDFNRLNSELIQKKTQVEELEQALPQKAETAEVIHKVSTQARSNGLQVQQIRPQKETVMRTRGGKGGDFRQLFINLGIRGGYEQLGEFLVGLEQQPFYVRVAELHLSKREKREQWLEIQLKLEVVVGS